MRILFFTGNIADSGGTERVCSVLAGALAERGYDVGILSLHEGSVPFFPVPSTVRLAALFPESLKFKYHYPAVVHRLRKFLTGYAPDIVIDVETILCLYTCVALSGLDSKHVVWEQYNIGIDLGVKLRRLARAGAVRWAHAVITLTERDAGHWRERYRPVVPVIAIPNPSPYPSLVHGDSYSVTSRTVLAAGHLIRRKGFDLLLRAWARVSVDVRGGWRLRIVGSGEEEQALKDLAWRLDVAGSVEFPGREREMAREYASAGLFVLSSRAEGFGMVLLEAMAFGLPAVSFDCNNGPSEILVDQHTGLLVPPEDVDALANAIRRMLTDVKFRHYCAHNAAVRANAFETGPIVERWLAVLNALRTDEPASGAAGGTEH